MSWEEMQGKFTEWSEPAIGAKRTAQVAELVGSLEALNSIRDLTVHLGV